MIAVAIAMMAYMTSFRYHCSEKPKDNLQACELATTVVCRLNDS